MSAPPATSVAAPNRDQRSSLGLLTLGALGVVYGDIGTSPLYAFKEAFAGSHRLALNEPNVYGVLSLLVWALMLIVSAKYVMLVLRFDNRGEGGVLSLYAFATRVTRDHPTAQRLVGGLAIFAAALFYGDAVITPAISVLSAVEGISVATPAFERLIVPITLGVLVGLFAIQRGGTGSVGKLFGPITIIWFATIGLTGVASIVASPEILLAIDPRYAARFVVDSPAASFIVLGAVFLALTGAEALYADMGHFGARAIRLAWFALVLPALVLNYFGQGALVLRDANAVGNPFYLLAGEGWLMPLVVLATAATVIASQATISGAFSVTQQASRLGFLPRIPVTHTSATERGQIYIGRVNWIMLALVIMLVLGFQSSSNLAAAYGIAVSGTMLLTTVLIGVVVGATAKGTKRMLLLGFLAAIGLIEMAFVASNMTKIAVGGWFPLVTGLILFTILTTWKAGSRYLAAHEQARRIPLMNFLPQTDGIPRVSNTAIYLSADPGAVPGPLLHALKHFQVMHSRVVVLTIASEDVPRVPETDRAAVQVLRPESIYQVTLHYGFMENPDVPHALQALGRFGLTFEPLATTYFLGKVTIERSANRGAFTWRRMLFSSMQRNAPSAVEYFKLPPERVVELGTRVAL